MRWPTLRIRGSTLLIVAAAVIGMAAIASLGLKALYDNLMAERCDKASQLVNVAHGLISHYESLARTRKMTTAEAQTAALDVVGGLRYGDDDYLWVNDLTPTMLVHPNRSLIGQYIGGITDPAGRALFMEFVGVVRAKGSGFVPYLWPKPGKQQAVHKISYVKGFQPWSWVVGTGIYLDDIDALFVRQASMVCGLSVMVMLVVTGISALVARRLILPIEAITAAMRRLSEGSLTTDVPFTDRHDEVGEMATAAQVFRAIAQDRIRLVETLVDMVVCVAPDGRLTFVNETTCRIMGLTRDQLIGRPWQDFVNQGDIDKTVDYIASNLRPPCLNISVENRIQTAKGERWYAWEGERVFNESGRRMDLEVVGRDITEQKWSEAERQNQLLLLQSLIEATPAAVFYKDQNGTYLGCNKQFSNLIGRHKDHIIGHPIGDLFAPSVTTIVQPADERVFQSRKPLSYNFIKTWGDEGERHLRIYKAPFDRADGSLGGLIGIALDITTDVHRENELRMAREAAEEASRAKCRFLVTMSHELRTPLNAIIGFSELLQAEKSLGGGRTDCNDYTHYIIDAGRHLRVIVEDIIAILKIDAGKLPYEPVCLSVGAISNTVIHNYRDMAAEAQLTLDIHVPISLPDIWADEWAVRKILSNLLSNAIKFTPAGGKVSLTAMCASDGIDIIVSDTGVGIPADQIDQVFEPFERIDNRYARSHGGTGLGLSLVRGLVKLNRGRMSIKSTVGVGSTFIVTLPLPFEVYEI